VSQVFDAMAAGALRQADRFSAASVAAMARSPIAWMTAGVSSRRPADSSSAAIRSSPVVGTIGVGATSAAVRAPNSRRRRAARRDGGGRRRNRWRDRARQRIEVQGDAMIWIVAARSRRRWARNARRHDVVGR
jgi:hypothetical protein